MRHGVGQHRRAKLAGSKMRFATVEYLNTSRRFHEIARAGGAGGQATKTRFATVEYLSTSRRFHEIARAGGAGGQATKNDGLPHGAA